MALALGCAWPTGASFAQAPFYDLELVGSPGFTAHRGQRLTGARREVSVNESGVVAFIAKYEAGSAVVAIEPDSGLKSLTFPDDDPGLSDPDLLTDYQFPVINSAGQVAARRTRAGMAQLRLLDADNPGDTTVITLEDTDVVTLPSLANDGSLGVVRLVGDDAELDDITALPLLEGVTPIEGLVRPVAADGRTFVIRTGTTADGSLDHFKRTGANAFAKTTIAATGAGAGGGWTGLGDSPGVSADGRLVAFAATKNEVHPAGPTVTRSGIYLSVLDAGVPGYDEPLTVIDDDTVIAYDGSAAPITMASFDFTNRVGVAHFPGGAAGLAGDRAVVVFIATPTKSSRPNPGRPSQPLLFNEKRAIWSVTVEFDKELKGNAIVAHPLPPVRVAQLGERLFGLQVFDLALYDPVARAEEADGFPVFSDGPSDHYIAFWARAGGSEYVIRAAWIDSDNDGLPDHWEEDGIDMDRDGTVDLDLPGMGADPVRRDLFLQLNWLPPRMAGVPEGWSHAPPPRTAWALARFFESAPLGNSDGSTGITLHLDAGSGNDAAGDPYSRNVGRASRYGGEISPATRPDLIYFGRAGVIGHPGFSAASVDSLREPVFGAVDQGARELAFRFCLVGDLYDVIPANTGNAFRFAVTSATATTVRMTFDPDDSRIEAAGKALTIISGPGAGQTRIVRDTDSATKEITIRGSFNPVPDATSLFVLTGTSSGRAEVGFRGGPDFGSVAGNDVMMTLGGWGLTGAVHRDGWIGNARLQASTILHEMGHALGLLHGGTDHCQYKGSDHLSIMSYTHQTRLAEGSAFQVGNGPEPPECHETTDRLADQPGGVFAPLFTFSDGSDPLGLNEWARLRMSPSSHGPHLGNTFGKAGLAGASTPEPAPDEPDPIPLEEPDVIDYEEVNGPLDLEPPEVTLLDPTSPGAAVAAGSGFDVRFTASDDRGVAGARVVFDLDGDGEIGPDEEFEAVPAGGGEYIARVEGVASSGSRNLRAEATDEGLNVGAAELEVQPALFTMSGSFPAAPAGAARATAPFGPVAIPAGGGVRVVVEATPGGGAEEASVTAATFRGESVAISTEYTPGGTSVCTTALDAGRDGNLEGTVGSIVPSGGPRPAQDYTLTVFFDGDVVPPEGALADPRARFFIGGTPSVLVAASDDDRVGSVRVWLDLNGDGDTADAGESGNASSAGDGLYVAEFPQLTGDPGQRAVSVRVRDRSRNETSFDATVLALADGADPEVSITFPGAGGAVAAGGDLVVEVEATDDRAIAGVTVTFDADGDGSVGGAAESVAAEPLGASTYRAVFAGVGGNAGLRDVVATAADGAGNTAVESLTVSVSAGGTGPQTLLSTSGSIPTQAGSFGGGSRQVIPFEPVIVPSRGIVRFTVTAAPPVRREVRNIPREDPRVRDITFNGEAQPRLTFNCNDFGADPAVCGSEFEAPGAGELAGEILGPGAWNTFGEFVGHAAQDYQLEIEFEPIDAAPPAVEFVSPGPGTQVTAGAGLTVDVEVRDPSGVGAVTLRFDRNGDGDSSDAGEEVAASDTGDAVYRATFAGTSGSPGTRGIEVEATDSFGNTVTAESFVGVGGAVGGGRQTLLITSGDIPAQGSDFAGGQRQTRAFPAVAIPGPGRVFLEVTASPPVRRAVQNIPRYDSAVERIRFNGVPVRLVPDCNPFGDDPSVCTSVWDPQGDGLLDGEVLGPATFTVFDEFAGHGAQGYTLKITFEHGPGVSSVTPSLGSTGGRTPVTVRGGGFEENAVVLFGGVAAADVTFLNSTELTCLTPPGVAGASDVTVVNPDPDNLPFGYGGPYGLFGRLSGGFTYEVPPPPADPAAERLIATFAGSFPEKQITELQESAQVAFDLPGAGGYRFEAWAFVPILSPIPGPAGDPDDLEYHNDSTAVPWFVGGDGLTYFMEPDCTPLDFAYGPVVCESVRANVRATAAGRGRMMVRGPARWSARWKELEVCELLGAPAQSWSIAVYHTPEAAAPGTYEGWQRAGFTAAELADPAVSGRLADPDRDGNPNAAEHALLGDPKSADPDLFRPVRHGGTPAVEFTVRSGLEGVDAAVEASATLATWSSYYAFTDDPGFASGLVLEATPVPGGTRLVVRVPDPSAPLAFLRYFRVRVDSAVE